MSETTIYADPEVNRKEDAAEAAEAVKMIELLPQAEREKVLYMLKGVVFAAETAICADKDKKNE